MQRALTAFQIQCEEQLANALAETGLSLEHRSVHGSRETYVRARIQGADLEVFIYEDEAGIGGSVVDESFESQDFDSGNDLIAAFVARALELSNRKPTQ